MRVTQILDDQSALSLVRPACDVSTSHASVHVKCYCSHPLCWFQIISKELEDEVVYRTLIAVGNLVSHIPQTDQPVSSFVSI